MNRDEFRSPDEHQYATVIFVPHARAKYRKLKVSHRLIFSVMSVIASSLCLSVFFSFQYVRSVTDERIVRTAETQKLERSLNAANAQVVAANSEMALRLREIDALTQRVLREQRNREVQLTEMRAQYESLKALTAGQEKIAEAHRMILQHRPLSDRLIGIGLGFSVGVLSSLVASLLWIWLRSKPLSRGDADDFDVS
jgi:hypothetical protein